jgi:thiamine biosynthesis lipoprotein
MNLLRKFLIFFVLAGLVFNPNARADDPTQLEITGRTMGPITYQVIVAHYPPSVTPEQLQAKIKAALSRVNGLMSTYIPDSDVSRFNNSESTEFQTVNQETAMVVARAIEISQQTDGAFDITVGPAVNLWNFGPGKKEFDLPSDQEVEAVKKLIGFKKLSVQMDPPGIRKSEPQLRIDLSAIAKGYAVDQVAKALDEAGCLQFMVEVGGEVFTRGERLKGGKWKIGVERPNDKMVREIAGVAEIMNQAMATSGDYRNFIEFEGQRYSHTIDPTTCRPVKHSLASACVVADDCMTADALATAIMVLGADQGAQICKNLGFECLTIERDVNQNDRLIERNSANFPLKQKVELNANPGGKKKAESIWPTFIGATIVFLTVIVSMAVGSIFANKPIRGSCGGLANMTNEDGEEQCGVCSKPVTDCVEKA